MGSKVFGIPRERALLLKTLWEINTFIETGTYRMGTTLWAASYFERVFSIEAHLERYRANAAHPWEERDVPVSLWHGDSAILLPQILKEHIHERALFWLDAHFMDEDGYASECPVLAEIRAINEHPYANQHVILIDDARLFIAPPPPPFNPEQWPTIETIILELSQPVHRAVVVLDDVIYALPPALFRGWNRLRN